jgi:hypothetical protein
MAQLFDARQHDRERTDAADSADDGRQPMGTGWGSVLANQTLVRQLEVDYIRIYQQQ